MNLFVATPSVIVVDATAVRHVRAEDDTGAFGVQPGHADFITVLAVGLLSFRTASGAERHVALRGGVFRVRGGSRVEVASREAIAGDDLDSLRHAILAGFRARAESEAKARTRAAQLNVALVRNLYRYVRSEPDGHLASFDTRRPGPLP